jgi:hypothetical protein
MLWSLIIFLIHMSYLILCVWTPLLDEGCGGGTLIFYRFKMSPPTYQLYLDARGVRGGGKKFWSPPLVRDLGAVTPKRNFGKNFLVKYCNFVVNLDHSL